MFIVTRAEQLRQIEAQQRLALLKKGPREETIEQARARVEQAKAALGLAEQVASTALQVFFQIGNTTFSATSLIACRSAGLISTSFIANFLCALQLACPVLQAVASSLATVARSQS